MVVRLTQSLLAACLALAIVFPASAHSAQARRPNIVFILADDLGYSDIAPYGGEVNTPALSALAEQGVRFANYHTAANCSRTFCLKACAAASSCLR